jgi:hypothetical protein
MAFADKVSGFFSNAAQTAVSLVKLALQTRKPTVTRILDTDDSSIIILGNGPSLADTIREHGDRLREVSTLAVNFFANTQEFNDLKPSRYILVDPHFFEGLNDDNVNRLWSNLARIEYAITLYVPIKYAKTARRLLGPHNSIKVETFNAVGCEGWQWLRRKAYLAGRGMPRPRNVLIPAIMVAMQAGFRTLYIAGADHSWLRTLSVNDANEVVSIQPHFYKEDEQEQSRVVSVYRNVKLHEVIYSFYVAFRSYHEIARYASWRGTAIYNITPGSYIDAFPRKQF